MAIIKHWAHYEARSGSIIGLYNSRSHKLNTIPESTISITTEQRHKIVKSPAAFRVINNKLEEGEAKVNSIHADLTELEARNKNVYFEKVGAGVKVDDVYFFADDEASAHVTQCLALIAHEQKKFKIKARVDGKVQYLEVDAKRLIKVAKAINALRTDAKESLIIENISVRSLA